MGQNSFLKHPKMEEEEEVPDSSHDINFLPQTNNFHVNKEKGILGIEDEEKMGDFIWDFMEWEDYSLEDQIKVEESSMFFQEEEEGNFSTNIKREELSSHGFRDDHIDEENEINGKKSKSLNLSLNYQEVVDAWSDRGSLWNAGFSLSSTKNGYGYGYGYGYTGEAAVTDQEERRRREAGVLRYKEKRRSRLFSKKIRYQVRKLNADKRPRLKGRFVKRVPEKIFK